MGGCRTEASVVVGLDVIFSGKMLFHAISGVVIMSEEGERCTGVA